MSHTCPIFFLESFFGVVIASNTVVYIQKVCKHPSPKYSFSHFCRQIDQLKRASRTNHFLLGSSSSNFPRYSNRSIEMYCSSTTVCSSGWIPLGPPSWICSEHHPSLESGKNTVEKEKLFKNLTEIRRIVKKLECFQTKIRIEISQFIDENPYFSKVISGTEHD
jgi:hypothetical protein